MTSFFSNHWRFNLHGKNAELLPTIQVVNKTETAALSAWINNLTLSKPSWYQIVF